MGAVELVLVRHGESTGNVSAAVAEAGQAEAIDLPCRDADIELSPTGHNQARALGELLGALPTAGRPKAVWVSPYRRAQDTAAIALRTAGLDLGIRTDERLRDRELGILDGLTARGVQVRFPAEAARHAWLGKFYYRPPGGESWVDLAQRLRTLLADVDRIHDGRRVLLVCHDALVVMTRYVCEGLSEAQVLDIERAPVRNASVTRLVRPSGKGWWTLETYNDVSHLAVLRAR